MLKECQLCNIVKSVEQFYTAGKYKDKQYYRNECIPCYNEHIRNHKPEVQRAYRQTEEYKKKRNEYKKSEKNLEYERKRSKERYYSEVNYKFKKCLRSRLKSALISKKWLKNNNLAQYLGCTIDELKVNFESKFQEGMSWEKFLNGEIEIDHIIPLASVNTPEEMYKLCHYTNLNPIWQKEHVQKSITDTKNILLERKTILRKANKV